MTPGSRSSTASGRRAKPPSSAGSRRKISTRKDGPVRIAPVHFLVVPKEHIPSAREAEARHEPALGRLVTVAARVAREMGVEATGYRLASNTGDDAGQTVFHLHLHCIGGRKLGPEG